MGEIVPRNQTPRREEDRRSQLLNGLCQWLIDADRCPTFVVDCTLNVLLLNEAARVLVAGGCVVQLTRGVLRLSLPKLNGALEKALQRSEVGSGILQIRDRDIGITLSARHVRTSSFSPRKLFVVTVARHSDVLLTGDELRRSFGLTRAESEVAAAIYSGRSLTRIAKERAASINTVKTQVRFIFEKCGVRSQVDLVRRFGTRHLSVQE
jgi:DNA-binding CsgD family transcriptional regulator